MVFAQNLGGGGLLRAGHARSTCTGTRPTPSRSTAAATSTPASSTTRARRPCRWADMSAAQGIGARRAAAAEDAGTGGGPTGPSRAGRRRGHAVPPAAARHGLAGDLLPRAAGHAALDVDPDPARGRRDRRLHPDLPVRQLHRHAQRVRRDVRPVVPLRAASRPCSRSRSPTRWPTRSRSRPGGGATCCWCWWSRRSSSASCCAPSPGSRSSPTTAWVADVLRFLHLLGPQDHIINTAPAVVIGITYNFLPFMILPIYASLERVDPRLMEAAGDLYANALTTLRKVTFPLSMPGVVAGTLLTFIPAAGDYINSALLGNRDTTMVGNVIDSRFLRGRRLPDRGRALGDADGLDPGARRRSTSAAPARRSWYDHDLAARDRGRLGRSSRWLSQRDPDLRRARRSPTCSSRSPTRSCSRSTTRASPTSPGRASPSRSGRTRAARPTSATSLANSLKIGAARDADRHRARHDGRLRAGPAPVPRPDRDQPD